MSLIWEPNFQSLFLSPLIGAVMGFAITWLLTPTPDHRTNANIAYNQVIKIFYTEVHHHHYGSSQEDGGAFMLGIVLMMGSAWLYLEHGPTVLDCLLFIAAFIIVASATFIVRRLLEGAGQGWVPRLVWPVAVAILAGILTVQDYPVVDYLVTHGMDFRYLASILGSDVFWNILYHVAGVLLLVGALVNSIMALLHQIALGSMDEPSDIFTFRGWLVRKTRRLGGPTGILISFVFLGMSWLCLSGEAIQIVRNLNAR